MAANNYEERAKALGIDRGKLETGFKDVEGDIEPSAPPAPAENIGENEQNAPKVPVTGIPITDSHPVKPENSQPVNNPVNKCRCGVTIAKASRRCRTCVLKDKTAKRLETVRSGVSLQATPSPPPPPVAPAEEEPVVLWHVLTQEQLCKIAVAVITGNGGTSHFDDIVAAVSEMMGNEVGSMLCTMVLQGELRISCHNKQVRYHGPGYVGIDWDYAI